MTLHGVVSPEDFAVFDGGPVVDFKITTVRFPLLLKLTEVPLLL